jgi:hypothetical protein
LNRVRSDSESRLGKWPVQFSSLASSWPATSQSVSRCTAPGTRGAGEVHQVRVAMTIPIIAKSSGLRLNELSVGTIEVNGRPVTVSADGRIAVRRRSDRAGVTRVRAGLVWRTPGGILGAGRGSPGRLLRGPWKMQSGHARPDDRQAVSRGASRWSLLHSPCGSPFRQECQNESLRHSSIVWIDSDLDWVDRGGPIASGGYRGVVARSYRLSAVEARRFLGFP